MNKFWTYMMLTAAYYGNIPQENRGLFKHCLRDIAVEGNCDVPDALLPSLESIIYLYGSTGGKYPDGTDLPWFAGVADTYGQLVINNKANDGYPLGEIALLKPKWEMAAGSLLDMLTTYNFTGTHRYYITNMFQPYTSLINPNWDDKLVLNILETLVPGLSFSTTPKEGYKLVGGKRKGDLDWRTYQVDSNWIGRVYRTGSSTNIPLDELIEVVYAKYEAPQPNGFITNGYNNAYLRIPKKALTLLRNGNDNSLIKDLEEVGALNELTTINALETYKENHAISYKKAHSLDKYNTLKRGTIILAPNVSNSKLLVYVLTDDTLLEDTGIIEEDQTTLNVLIINEIEINEFKTDPEKWIDSHYTDDLLSITVKTHECIGIEEV